MIIPVLAVDPALANFGIARLLVDTDTMKIEVTKLRLVETERRVNKVVRQNSDDLRRTREIVAAFHEECANCMICFAEIPTGAQSARAMYAFGAAVGILASCPIPIIEVQPFETKLATVGTKTASKEEMIEWAGEAHPNAPWRRYEKDFVRKGKLVKPAGAFYDDQEHLADAVAVGHAGIRTEEFKKLVVMWKNSARPQAA